MMFSQDIARFPEQVWGWGPGTRIVLALGIAVLIGVVGVVLLARGGSSMDSASGEAASDRRTDYDARSEESGEYQR